MGSAGILVFPARGPSAAAGRRDPADAGALIDGGHDAAKILPSTESDKIDYVKYEERRRPRRLARRRLAAGRWRAGRPRSSRRDAGAPLQSRSHRTAPP